MKTTAFIFVLLQASYSLCWLANYNGLHVAYVASIGVLSGFISGLIAGKV